MRAFPGFVLAILLLLAGCLGNNGTGGPAQPTPLPDGSYTACSAPTAPDATWQAQKPRVLIETTQGNMTAALDMEGAPVTASNFLNLTQKGFFDGLLFHRVVAGFVIQGGDPLSKNPNPAVWGSGGPGYAIPDEFNPTLRHDKEGVLSMAHAGPNTGGSQFFITLAPAPSLDDRHSVFGTLTDGTGTLEAIGKLHTNSRDQPEPNVTMTRVSVLDPAPFDARHGLALHPVLDEKTTEAGRNVTFALVVSNRGNVRDAPAIGAALPAGWTCAVEGDPVALAGNARVLLLHLTPPSDAASAQIALRATSAWNGTTPATALVHVTIGKLGAAVKNGDTVTANYVGFLPDGRLFDTSVEKVANDEAMPKFATQGGFTPRGAGQYKTFGFTVGSGVIAGFTNLALTAKEGETVTGFIPAKDAYASGNVYQRPLTGKALVFELQIVKIGSG